jgi:hypothetical protein
MGQTRWYKDINPQATYLVAHDPSLGTGGDYGAIQVFEMPTMEQVAEWRHNLTPIQSQVKVMREILKYIQDRGIERGGQPQLYYSVENNSLGEAALIVIRDIGEENFGLGQDAGYMLGEHDPSGQNNRSFKYFYGTDSGFNGGASMEPKGHDGCSSGHFGWRD